MYNNNLRIIQEEDAFSFSLDTLLLDCFAQIRIHDNYKVVDLCSGDTAASIYISYFSRAHYDAIEIQTDMVDQARCSIGLNRLENRIGVHYLDALGVPKKLGKGKYDMVVINLPYFKVPKGHIINLDEREALTRHELAVNLEQIIKASSDMLKMKGKMFVTHRPERLGEIMRYCLENHLSVKWVQPFVSRRNTDANLVVVETIRNIASDGLALRDAIIVHNQDGSSTPGIGQAISENKKQEKESKKEDYYFYCLLCNDGSFYDGFTSDLKHRLRVHSEGKDTKYTKSRRPVETICHEESDDKRLTLRREHWFKHYSRKWKEDFLKEHNVKL